MFIIKTKRLILREYEQSDFEELKKIITDPYTMRYYNKPYDLEGVNRWINWCINSYKENGFGLWAIELKDSNTFIGDCGLSIQNIDEEYLPEVGYHINKKYWNNGYAKEAGIAVIKWAFENTNYTKLYSYMNKNNIPSFKTALSIGMKKIKEYTDKTNEELIVCQIEKSDYLSNIL